jgi:glycosyltransferase involved in cell wall biosynthesis
MKPDLSIIIPTKDRESILHQTLESAYRALEHLNGEVIVVNDSDQPLQLDAYPQVRLTKNPKAGVASARNHGSLYCVLLILSSLWMMISSR